MRAHYLQHVPFEGLGSIAHWLTAQRYQISGTCFFEAPGLPEIDEIDLVIVLGGPMSVNDEQLFPWLSAEKAFIRRAIEAGKAVLGICLGAQLIAAALGARVYPNAIKEIGWFPVQGLPAGGEAFNFPPELEAFHWHGETFDLPTGAVQLARSAACENQAFQVGTAVIGLQFHLESTPGGVGNLITHCRSELLPGRYVQTEAEMLAGVTAKYRASNKLMSQLLSYLQG